MITNSLDINLQSNGKQASTRININSVFQDPVNFLFSRSEAFHRSKILHPRSWKKYVTIETPLYLLLEENNECLMQYLSCCFCFSYHGLQSRYSTSNFLLDRIAYPQGRHQPTEWSIETCHLSEITRCSCSDRLQQLNGTRNNAQ